MVVYKKCRICRKLFESTLLEINSFCTDHQDLYRSFLRDKLQQRYIPPEWLNVYDENGHRICRACGAQLLKKDGSYASVKVQCGKKECKIILDEWFGKMNFASARNKYLDLYYEKYWTRIKEYSSLHHDGLGVFCELCDKYTLNYEIHHRTAVFLTDLSQWHLVFDSQNLILLCKECHVKQHKEVHKRRGQMMRIIKPTIPQMVKNKKLTEWFQ